ncbi:hypothetical protein, partial [Escherichia coli]|uniref:hypothetical protein n=1 Tax=Escherichia coli TaxID=562 RepID=UPI00257511D9
RVFKVTGRDQRWQHSSRCPNIFYALQIENILQLRSLDIADWMMSLENVSGLLGQKPVTK